MKLLKGLNEMVGVPFIESTETFYDRGFISFSLLTIHV